MGWCHDFNVEIAEGCSHPMRAGVSYCTCTECGVVCHGKFDACKEVWIQLPSRSKKGDTNRGTHGAQARMPTGEPARTIRLSEPVEIPPAGTRPPPAPIEPVRPFEPGAGEVAPGQPVDRPVPEPAVGATSPVGSIRPTELPAGVRDLLGRMVSAAVDEAREARQSGTDEAVRHLEALRSETALLAGAVDVRIAGLHDGGGRAA